jgi:hypothetical protein
MKAGHREDEHDAHAQQGIDRAIGESVQRQDAGD